MVTGMARLNDRTIQKVGLEALLALDLLEGNIVLLQFCIVAELP